MTTTRVPAGEAFRLAPRFAERIWGRHDLRPWYEMSSLAKPVGEAWLTGPDCIVDTGVHVSQSFKSLQPDFPLLVKLLFPEEKLSVQVHPDDARAQAMGLLRGKTECWYVLDAEPGASVACGLKPGVNQAQLRASAGDGTMESLLTWLPLTAGDMIFVDAGTVHAIGGGMTILEVQQTCDVTYRLFDYGRPRELHLEEGMAAVKLVTKAGKVEPRRLNGFDRLIESDYFVVDRFEGPAIFDMAGEGCVVGLAGEGRANGVDFKAGEAVILPRGETVVQGTSPVFLRCFAPK